MTDNDRLYLHHGTIQGQDWKQEVGKLGIQPNEATYSWYEPNPESFIGTGAEVPFVCFFKGEPNIPAGVTWSRLVLFYDDGSLTLVPGEDDLRYAWWQTEEFPNAYEIKPVVSLSERALLKTQDRLTKQFGLEKKIDLFPVKDKNLKEQSPKIVEYYHQGKRIAWTLK